MKDITLSDGTFIPKGTQITGPARAIHHDEEVYQNPEVFDPMRFVDLRSENPHESSKYQMTSTNPEYLSFGLGESAWCVIILSLVHSRVPADRSTAPVDSLQLLCRRVCLHTSSHRTISSWRRIPCLRSAYPLEMTTWQIQLRRSCSGRGLINLGARI